MSNQLLNPMKRRVTYNHSVEMRLIDMLHDEAKLKQTSSSEIVNEIIKHHFGVVD